MCFLRGLIKISTGRFIPTNKLSPNPSWGKNICSNTQKRSVFLVSQMHMCAIYNPSAYKCLFSAPTEACAVSSSPSGKDRRQPLLFIRRPAIWNQISPEDTMKLQIFSLPVHLPAKAHRINITTLSLSSCYKLALWWHFDQACVSPQSLTWSLMCTHTHSHTRAASRVSPFSVSLQPFY